MGGGNHVSQKTQKTSGLLAVEWHPCRGQRPGLTCPELRDPEPGLCRRRSRGAKFFSHGTEARSEEVHMGRKQKHTDAHGCSDKPCAQSPTIAGTSNGQEHPEWLTLGLTTSFTEPPRHVDVTLQVVQGIYLFHSGTVRGTLG